MFIWGNKYDIKAIHFGWLGGVLMRRKLYRFVSLVLSGVMVLACPMLPINNSYNVQAADIPIRENIESKASDNTVIIGVEGVDNTSDLKTLLDRVNAVRKAACDAGDPDPRNPQDNLQPSDYVPIKIGEFCTQAAQIRAAEAAIKGGHARPNSMDSMSCLDVIQSINSNCGGCGENLAWNTVGESYIEGWIGERNDWITYRRTDNLPKINGNRVQTGHYAALINPDYKFTGMSTFNPVNDNAWEYRTGWYCTAGSYAESDKEMTSLPGLQNSSCIQKIEVPVNNVKEMEISGTTVLNEGDTASFKLLVDVLYTQTGDGAISDNTTCNCPVYDGVTWKSSDDSIISIDGAGVATVQKSGTVQIEASIGTGSNKKTIDRKVVVLSEGVSVVGAVDPETVETESGISPSLSSSAELTLSNNDKVSVNVDWDDYDESNLNTVRYSKDFYVTGKAMGYDVKQKVHVKPASIVRSYGRKNSVELDTLVTDSGKCPENLDSEVIVFKRGITSIGYPLATDWLSAQTTQFMGESDGFTLTWDKESLEKYKDRNGGDFVITGKASFMYDGKLIDYPVSQKMHVNPATVTSVQMPSSSTVIETASGTAPVLPKAKVTWSNGDVDEDDITWTGNTPSATYESLDDISRKYMAKSGGTYTVTGTYEDKSVAVTVKVNPATAVKATLDKANYETKCGTAPSLPITAKVTWSNGDETDETITWEALDPEKYNVIEGNEYSVKGTCCGCEVTANISVLPATISSIAAMTITTSERVDPTSSLPKNATINWSNNTSSELQVTWDAIDKSKYAAPGSFEAVGYVTDMYKNTVKVICDVTVKARQLSSISLENGKLDTDTFYYNYSLSGINGSIIATYDNGETSKKNITSVMISGFDVNSSSSNQEISIIYTEGEISKNVKTKIYLIKRTGIEITKLPSKLQYVEDEVSQFDISGLEVKEVLDNGEKKIISSSEYSSANITGFNPKPSKYGDQEISFSIYGFTAKFTVNVRQKQLSKVTIVSKPKKLSYIAGQTPSMDGLVVRGTYDNGKSEELAVNEIRMDAVTEGANRTLGDIWNTSIPGMHTCYAWFPTKVTQDASGTVTTSYIGASFEISVAEKVVDSLEWVTQPSKTEYPQNDKAFSSASFSDGVVKVTFNDAEERELSLTETSVTGFDISKLGAQTVTVTYGGKSVTFDANVTEPAISKQYVTPPALTNYADGEALNLAGMQIVTEMNNGYVSTLDVTGANEDITISLDDASDITAPLSNGEKTLNVSYKGVALKDADGNDIKINVARRMGIRIKTNPNVTSYTVGISLADISLAGLELESVFENGLTAPIDASLVEMGENASFDGASAGVKSIEVKAYGLTTSFNIELKAASSGGNKPDGTSNDGPDSGKTPADDKANNGSNSGTGSKPGGTNKSGSSSNPDGGTSTNPLDSNTGTGSNSGKNNSGTGSSSGNNNSGVGNESGSGSNVETPAPAAPAPSYCNEWINGVWYDENGNNTYPGTLSWKSNSTGWWVEDSAGWYPVNCWQKIDGQWYYFNSSGYMASSEWYNGYWFSGSGAWDETYKMTWCSNSTGWWIEDISGWWPSNCWQKIDGSWYYFDGSGYMVTSRYIDGYWIGANGVCQ